MAVSTDLESPSARQRCHFLATVASSKKLHNVYIQGFCPSTSVSNRPAIFLLLWLQAAALLAVALLPPHHLFLLPQPCWQ